MARKTTEEAIAEWLCKRYGSVSPRNLDTAGREAWARDARALMKHVDRPILKNRIIDDGSPPEKAPPEKNISLSDLISIRERRDLDKLQAAGKIPYDPPIHPTNPNLDCECGGKLHEQGSFWVCDRCGK